MSFWASRFIPDLGNTNMVIIQNTKSTYLTAHRAFKDIQRTFPDIMTPVSIFPLGFLWFRRRTDLLVEALNDLNLLEIQSFEVNKDLLKLDKIASLNIVCLYLLVLSLATCRDFLSDFNWG